jgi:signal transduction histidine kinase
MKQDAYLLSQQYVTALEPPLKHGRSAGLEAISDGGKSCEMERVLNARSPMHLCRLGRRERVEMVGGRFGLESAPGRGTTIAAQLPHGGPDRVHENQTCSI